MDEIKFSSITDLYNRLFPALQVKNEEFLLEGIDSTELKIWNVLKTEKWIKETNLTLSDMVNDIINLDIEEYLKLKNGE